ncbi:type III restriction endonuclease subunit R [[Mycoplasma] phocae]|uniref:Type III restriction endonuclease subunit R n=1 Tax=[Mycoplasma] phocae TaxID=142651 RepID=A0A2Z5IS92_9BACT|nr:DEAD/DEAH box helicase family protein [[Mycoplasma] phocae]AXE60508.1 type III restriction endonuclease subunit R [[Mycoplasma] phocae]
MQLTSVQLRAVEELINNFSESYNFSECGKDKNTIEFKAPTGSGKTFMLANFIDRAITFNREFNSNQKIIFVIATLSSADLPKQMETNLRDYAIYLNNRDVNIQRYESPSISDKNLKDREFKFLAENEKVIIFGSSSFGKNRIFTEYGILDAFLDQIKNEDYKLVYIRDEAHYGGDGKKTSKEYETRFESKIQNAANFILKMTATPKGANKQVIITEKQLEEDNIQLLKRNQKYNFGIDNLEEDEISNIHMLNQACQQFKVLKNEYYNDREKEPGLFNINPAMLIQVSDKRKEKESEFEKNIQEIIECLNVNNLTYAKYFSSDKIDSDQRNIKSLKDISKDSSDIDVIIFKVGPATGWNIPRACMLVQLRNVSSDTLNVQTIGRIKRNPKPGYPFEPSSVANDYYVYSNNSSYKREVANFRLRPEFEKINFATGNINKELLSEAVNNKKYHDDVLAIFSQEQIIKFGKDYLNHFKKYGYLIGKEVEIADGGSNVKKSLIEQKIFNSIQLEKFVLDFKVANKNLFKSTIINSINSWFYSIIANNNNNKISLYLFWYIVAKHYLNAIRKCYKDAIQRLSLSDNIKEYIIRFSKTLPINHYVYIGKNNLKEIETLKLKYGYLNTIKKEENKHYFDSNPELNFVSNVLKYLNQNHEYEHLKIWSKNPVINGMSFEYYTEENDIKNSYPDFIFIYKGHQILVEIKSFENDYDPQKSTKLIEAYEKYIEDHISSNFDHSLSLILAYVSGKESEYMLFRGSSTIKNVKELCQSENNIASHKLENIFEKINEYIDSTK